MMLALLFDAAHGLKTLNIQVGFFFFFFFYKSLYKCTGHTIAV